MQGFLLSEKLHTLVSSNYETFQMVSDSAGNIPPPLEIILHQHYSLGELFAKGASGEVWLARVPDKPHVSYVLKRIISPSLHLTGVREVHFGERLRGMSHIARFIDSFEEGGEFWLVFLYEGVSLHSLLYQSTNGGIVERKQESWAEFKSSPAMMIGIIKDVLVGLSHCHALNITHRDIKSANILVKGTFPNLHAVVADFGSALDKESIGSMYSHFGPTKAEQTADYAPPESIFGDIPFYLNDPRSYDIWSVGVLFLELILGTPQVFQIDSRTCSIIEKQMNPTSEQNDRFKACLFQAMIEYCVFDPVSLYNADLQQRAVSLKECDENDMNSALRKWDPLGLGAPSRWCLLLIRVLFVLFLLLC